MRDEKKLSEEELDEIRVMYRQARNKSEQFRILRDLYLVSEKTLLRVLGLEAAPKRPSVGRPKIPLETKAAAARDFANGLTLRQAAAKYGISDSVICEFMKKVVNG